MNKNIKWLLITLSVLLVISNPAILPIVLFAAILFFTTTKKGKEMFDLEKWKKQWEEAEREVKKSEKKSSSKSEKQDAKTDTKDEILENNAADDVSSVVEKFLQDRASQQQKSSKSPLGNKKSQNSFTFSSMNQNFSENPVPKSLIFVGIGIFILGTIVMDGIVNVPVGQTGVVFDRLLRKVDDNTLPQGINLKVPFFQKVTIVDLRLQEHTITETSKGSEPIEALTKDGQKVNIDITLNFLIEKKDAANLVEKIGMDYENKAVVPAIRAVVREVITGYNSTELFKQETRSKATEEIKTRLTENLSKKYIAVQDVLVRNIRFSENYLKAIEEKQIAEQKIQKAEFEKKEAEVLKDKKIIEAQGESEAIRLKVEAIGNNPNVVQWQFVEKMAPNVSWGILPDGALPMLDVSKMQKTQ